MRLRIFPVRSPSSPNFRSFSETEATTHSKQTRLFRIFFPSSPSLILITSPWHLPCFPTPSRVLASTWPARYNTFPIPIGPTRTFSKNPHHLQPHQQTISGVERESTEINTNTTHSGADPAPTSMGPLDITSTFHQTTDHTSQYARITSAANPNCDATHGSSLRSLLIFGSTAFRNAKQTLFGKKNMNRDKTPWSCLCLFNGRSGSHYSLTGIT